MKLANPNSNQPFDRVSKNAQGGDEYGFRMVDGLEEVVHIPTGKSNMEYWQREPITNPQGCSHDFFIEDLGKREIRCRNTQCDYGLTFHVKDIVENSDGVFVKLRGKLYKVES